jgi:hypothetical protein
MFRVPSRKSLGAKSRRVHDPADLLGGSCPWNQIALSEMLEELCEHAMTVRVNTTSHSAGVISVVDG